MLVLLPLAGGITPATHPASKNSLIPPRRRILVVSAADSNIFPSFIPKQVEKVKDLHAQKMASRMQQLPVQLSGLNKPILSSCVRPIVLAKTNPLVLLHGFDSSCLEWRYTLPLLEDANLEAWVVDILGWGFSDLESRPACTVVSKREHLYQFWKSYIKRPMILVGPSLGAAVAIDFAVNHPEAVDKLILIDASVYAEGTGNLSKLPKVVAYAGVYFLKSFLLRFYATNLTFNGIPFDTCLDWSHIGRLHCLLPWWVDTTVTFMNSGGYNVRNLIKQVKHETLIIWGEDDQIVDNRLAVRLHCELANAILRQIPDCGHIPHVEKPKDAAKLIMEFVKAESLVLTR
ncbi:hypothetical protein DCAR_0727309 [Daucus carota subsp. sativus]|uniref:AB hydrolase-1 domain-containing protein n=1 Tax=Daucus carota subsp. sativus TaxID=79200 RepID=A0A161ZKV4_DAUCS|nr:PREDICTED: uncharacterized hydrolase YugF-like [Daucus carota subsp. sativus]WOH07875.1 hypothetical protein DCAR_0727309 [Daucus carota subsp. sativus]